MHSDDEFIANRRIQSRERGLYEGGPDVASRGELNCRGGGDVLPCGVSTSTHSLVERFRHLSETDVDDDSYVVRKFVSSSAIPEFGRQYFKDETTNLTTEEATLAYYHTQHQQQQQQQQQQQILRTNNIYPEDSIYSPNKLNNHDCQHLQPRRSRRPTFSDDDSLAHNHHDLSSEGSYEQINLDDVSIDVPYRETHLSLPPRQEEYVWEEDDSNCHELELRSPQGRTGKQWKTHTRQSSMTSEDDDDESYLEESPLCSGRPIICILEDDNESIGRQTKTYNLYPDAGPLPRYSRSDSEGKLNATEKQLLYLNQTVYKLKMERNELMELHKFRSREWMGLKDRLRAEIIELREQNTTLMCDRMNKGGRLNKRIAQTLLRAKHDSDRALATTLERQQKINELRLLVTMQQRYILNLEESMGELQRVIHSTAQAKEEEESPIPKAKLTELPMRHPTQQQVLSEYQDVLGCDRSNYMPGTTTDPELATVEVFDFAGETRLLTHKRDLESFDMMKVPYVRGALSSASND